MDSNFNSAEADDMDIGKVSTGSSWGEECNPWEDIMRLVKLPHQIDLLTMLQILLFRRYMMAWSNNHLAKIGATYMDSSGQSKVFESQEFPAIEELALPFETRIKMREWFEELEIQHVPVRLHYMKEGLNPPDLTLWVKQRRNIKYRP